MSKSQHLSNDMNISKMFVSKHHDLQKIYYIFLVRLYSMMILIKLKEYLIVFLMLMILMMVQYIRYTYVCASARQPSFLETAQHPQGVCPGYSPERTRINETAGERRT